MIDLCMRIYYNLCKGKSEVIKMSPRTGRPPKGEASRRTNLNLRVSESEAQLIKDCAELLDTTRTDVIIRGVKMLKESLDKK